MKPIPISCCVFLALISWSPAAGALSVSLTGDPYRIVRSGVTLPTSGADLDSSSCYSLGSWTGAAFSSESGYNNVGGVDPVFMSGESRTIQQSSIALRDGSLTIDFCSSMGNSSGGAYGGMVVYDSYTLLRLAFTIDESAQYSLSAGPFFVGTDEADMHASLSGVFNIDRNPGLLEGVLDPGSHEISFSGWNYDHAPYSGEYHFSLGPVAGAPANPVPEPPTLLLSLLGIVGILAAGRIPRKH